MAGLDHHEGRIAVYNGDHMDTDRIIPARFLTMVTKTGYGELCFIDDRKRENHPLNTREAQGASILVVGTNFGCGSSREHAVWALQQAGYVAVIARKEAASPGYSDIFRQNSANCGMLLIELEADAHAELVNAGSGATASFSVSEQTVSVNGKSFGFDIAPASKDQILKGLDLIGTTLVYTDAIAEYEKSAQLFR